MGDFGKLNFSVSFDRTSAFPLDGNSYFTSYSDAELAASSAVEVGSSDSTYYIGQVLTVVENESSKNYIIQPDKTLSEIGSDPEVAVTNGEEPQGDELLWVDTSKDAEISSLKELGIQPKLESGVNIKTINGESILGEGNIELSSSGGGLDDAPSDGVTYGRKDGSWVKANYSTPNEVLDLTDIITDAIPGEATTITTPEGFYEKVENAYNKGFNYVKLKPVFVEYDIITTLNIAKGTGSNINEEGFFITMKFGIPYVHGYVFILSYYLAIAKDNIIYMIGQIPSPIDSTEHGSIVSEYGVPLIKLRNYSKPSSYSAIKSIDSISTAIGKLEAGLGSIDTILDNINGEVI